MHILIIPDGNRRWARQHTRPSFAGHQQGAKTFKSILSEALRLRIPYVICWVLSKSNITNRSPSEVKFL